MGEVGGLVACMGLALVAEVGTVAAEQLPPKGGPWVVVRLALFRILQAAGPKVAGVVVLAMLL